VFIDCAKNSSDAAYQAEAAAIFASFALRYEPVAEGHMTSTYENFDDLRNANR
jgi:hypothetical protein